VSQGNGLIRSAYAQLQVGRPRSRFHKPERTALDYRVKRGNDVVMKANPNPNATLHPSPIFEIVARPIARGVNREIPIFEIGARPITRTVNRRTNKKSESRNPAPPTHVIAGLDPATQGPVS